MRNVRNTFAPLAFFLGILLLSSCSTLRPVDSAYSSFEEGLASFNQGHFDAAITRFRRSTLKDPTFAPAYLYLGRSYISLGRWRLALQPLRTAFRLSPDEFRDEIMNLLIDAAFAAALGPGAGEVWPHGAHKEVL